MGIKRKTIEEKVNSMEILVVNGERHVIAQCQDEKGNRPIDMPNYCDKFNWVLCGILLSGQTLESFKSKYLEQKLSNIIE